MPPRRALIAATLAAAAAAAAPSFNVSNVFSSHAVLQRDKPMLLWGWAASAGITLSAVWVDGQKYTAQPDPAQSLLWRLALPAAPAAAAPFALTVASSAGDSVTLEDLLLGDVIMCAGQSNVGAVTVAAMANASDIVSAAEALGGVLRIFQVSGNVQSNFSMLEWPTSGLVPWQTPIGAGGSNASLLGFSAVCYILGSTLVTEYISAGGVPVGLLHSSHGGTSIQAWQSSQAVVDACGDPSNSWPSSVLYNTNVAPLAVGPLALKAVYWYQGEQDCGIGATETYWRAAWYGCSLQALIRDWRARLADAALFFVVQELHAWLHTSDIGLAVFRQAQHKALLLPRTALSTAFDGGDPAAAMAGQPGGTVHSHLKFIPGRRAAAALAGALYALPGVAWLNPRYADATAMAVSNATHTALTVRVALAPGTVSARGLVMRGWESESNSSHCPTERAVNASYCAWFSIQSNDGAFSWHNATARLTGDADFPLELSAVAPQPGLAAVRTSFGWGDWPVATVYSAEGLPLMTWNRELNGGGAL